MAKRGRGRPPVITEEVTSRILAILTAGGSLSDAADVVGVGYKTVLRKRRTEVNFATRLKKAVKEGKLNLIRKVGTAKPWQAAAFMLERKWWQEFSRKDKVHAEHTGKGGGAIKYETKVAFDYESFQRELSRVDGEISRPPGLPSANGN